MASGEMKKLLEELKAIDPACYDEIWRWALWQEDQDDYENETEEHDYENHRNDVIQGCVQRAVVARGWHWLLEDGDPSITCGMFQCDIFDSEYNTMKCYVPGDSPAKAILAAYIAARRAQP
jgi:hypothetical protein